MALASGQALLEQAVGLHKEGKLVEAEQIYHRLLGACPDDPTLLYLMGDVLARTGRFGVAINLFMACLQVKPDFREAYIDLGVSLKAEHHDDLARRAWEKALELDWNQQQAHINLATLYADSGEPDKALAHIEDACKVGPPDHRADWNRALALLSKRDWQEAWKYHESRKKIESYHPRTKFGLQEWDGEWGKHVLVHGEQGIGDEIMFLSCLPDLMARSKRVTLEIQPRLIAVVERSFGVQAYATEAETPNLGYDRIVALGTLPYFFRKRDADFPGAPYLKAEPALVEFFRRELERIGPRPWIGIAWYGGVKTTRPHERTIPLEALTPIRAGYTCVSVQYGKESTIEADRCGLPVLDYSAGQNMEAQFALVSALDAVVTVPQTIVHVCGAVGTRCFVLTPKRASWRYGVEGEWMPWYRSVHLIRQNEDRDWIPIIDALAMRIESDFAARQEVKCASAF